MAAAWRTGNDPGSEGEVLSDVASLNVDPEAHSGEVVFEVGAPITIFRSENQSDDSAQTAFVVGLRLKPPERDDGGPK